jgi:hypothetical protein
VNHYERAAPIGDRRQNHRSHIGERMFRQRIYMLAEVWEQLDALMRMHGDENVNKILARLVRDAHRRMKADDDSTRTQ